jgi:tetratricopeptide (TPR) repeat protein
MREYARAESLDRVNVRRFPDNPSVREGLIRRLIELNRLDDAEREIDAALKQFPQHWMTQWWKIRTLYYRGRYDDFERALDSLSRDPELYKRQLAMDMRVKMAETRGRLRERERLKLESRTLNQAASVGAQSAPTPLQQTWDEIWLARVRQRDPSALVARADSFQRLRPPPKTAEAAFSVVVRFANEGRRPDIAQGYLDRFLASLPDSVRDRQPDGHFNHWSRHFIAVAENRAREAIDQRWLADRYRDGFPGPHQLALYRDLGLAYDKAGNADSTMLLFERLVNEPSQATLDVHQGDVHNYLRRLGELYEQNGNRPKAIEYYSRFVELWKNADPDLQPQVADIRGRIARLRTS